MGRVNGLSSLWFYLGLSNGRHNGRLGGRVEVQERVRLGPYSFTSSLPGHSWLWQWLHSFRKGWLLRSPLPPALSGLCICSFPCPGGQRGGHDAPVLLPRKPLRLLPDACPLPTPYKWPFFIKPSFITRFEGSSDSSRDPEGDNCLIQVPCDQRRDSLAPQAKDQALERGCSRTPGTAPHHHGVCRGRNRPYPRTHTHPLSTTHL